MWYAFICIFYKFIEKLSPFLRTMFLQKFIRIRNRKFSNISLFVKHFLTLFLRVVFFNVLESSTFSSSYFSAFHRNVPEISSNLKPKGLKYSIIYGKLLHNFNNNVFISLSEVNKKWVNSVLKDSRMLYF